MTDVEAELRAHAESDGVEFFFAMFVDMHGKPCAKMIPTQALDVLAGGGAGFAGFAAGPMGQSPADPDMIAMPDPASYTLAPWQPGLAVVQKPGLEPPVPAPRPCAVVRGRADTVLAVVAGQIPA
jgi:glutamine synthetase